MKLLQLMIFCAIVWWIWRYWRRRMGPISGAKPPEFAPMVRCVHCGLHLPRAEALQVGGQIFCSREHAELQASKPDGAD